MAEPLTVLFLDSSGVVLAIRRLARNALARHPGATWVVELPVAIPPPSVGARLQPWAGKRT